MRIGRLRNWAARIVLTIVALAAPVAVWAQEPQSQFVPADTLPQEVLPATPFVFAAYAFVWLALLVYVFVLWRRMGRVERELADLSARLASRKS